MNEKSRLAEFAAQLRVRRSAIRLSLVALMSPVLALSACAGSDDEAAAGGDSIEIALVNPYKGHPFTRSTECGALREAKRLGVDLTITGATEYSVANVTQVLNAAAAAQPDGVIVPIWDPVAYLNAIRNLADTGAVVVGVNGKPEDDSNLTSYILTDEHQGGLLAAEAMLTKVESGDIVLVLENNPTNLVSKARAAGFIEEMEAAGVDVLPVQYTDEDTTKTTSIVQATLAKHPDLAGIYETKIGRAHV